MDVFEFYEESCPVIDELKLALRYNFLPRDSGKCCMNASILKLIGYYKKTKKPLCTENSHPIKLNTKKFLTLFSRQHNK